MTTNDANMPDEELLDHLAASAEALAAGRTPLPPSGGPSTGAAEPADWQELLGCLLVLETVRPPQTIGLSSPPAPPHIPGFVIERELGRGGMGVVYLATDLALRRLVALKILRPNPFGGSSDGTRLRTEAEAAARLRHPNIISVFSGGEVAGLTYQVMEYVEGITLGQRLGGKPILPREATGLVELLASAVDHAHSKGVIHRDLKPANILLAPDGTPRIADFGLARLLDRAGGQTSAGQILGTAEYMAPEQTATATERTGPAADVYALGAILYECLTGRPPFRGATPFDTLHQVRTADPVPPRRLSPRVPSDLETVVLTCLEKDPARRYSSAKALADDLNRFARGEVLWARPVGRLERARRWCRRFPALAALLGLLVATTILAVLLAITRVRSAREAAESRNLAERDLYLADMSRIRLAWENRDITRVAALLDRHCPAGERPDRRTWEWHYWDRLYHTACRVLSHPGGVSALAVRPDGRRIATSGKGKIRVWDTDTGEELFAIANSSDRAGVALAYSPNGRHLYAGGETICSWDADTGTLDRVLGKTAAPVSAIRVHPDGRRIVICDETSARVWDAGTGRQLRVFPPGGVYSNVAIRPPGRHIAVGGEDGLSLYDVDNGNLLWSLRPPGFVDLAFNPDGSLLAARRGDGPFQLLNAATGNVVLDPVSPGALGPLAFSPDGRRFAVGGGPHAALSVGDGESGSALFELIGHERSLSGVTFTPDGKSIVSAANDGTARIWDDVDPECRLSELTKHGRFFHAAFRPDGHVLAVGDDQGQIRQWDVPTGRELLPPLPGPAKQTYALAYSSGGWLAAAGGDPGSDSENGYRIRVWNPTGDESRMLAGTTKWVWSVAFRPDGRRLATSGSERIVRVWDVTSGQMIRVIRGFGGRVLCVAYSPDGQRLATACGDHRVRVFDAADNGPTEPLQVLEGHTDEVFGLAYSPDGQWLASCAWDHTARLWQASTGQVVRIFSGHANHVWSVAFAPDGNRLATTGEDGTVRLWDVTTGEEVLVVHDRHTPCFYSVAFSPDGGRVIAAGDRGVLRLLDGRPREPARPIRNQD